MPSFNFPQKIFLAIFGVAILIIQLIRFDEYGLEGIGWVFSLAISALLILPMLTEVERIKSIFSDSKNKQNNMGAFATMVGNHVVAVNLVKDISKDAEDLRLGIYDLVAIPELNFKLISSGWSQYCLSYVLSIYSITQHKKDINYFKSNQYFSLVSQTSKLIVSSLQTQAKEFGLNSANLATSEKDATKSILQARIVGEKFIKEFANENLNADSLMFNYLYDSLGLTGELQEKTAPFIRDFTKDLMVKYAQY